MANIEDIKIEIGDFVIYYSGIQYFEGLSVKYNNEFIELSQEVFDILVKGKDKYELLKLQISQSDLEERVQKEVNGIVESSLKNRLSDIETEMKNSLRSIDDTKKTLCKELNSLATETKNTQANLETITKKLSTAFSEFDSDKFSERMENSRRWLNDARVDLEKTNKQLKELFED